MRNNCCIFGIEEMLHFLLGVFTVTTLQILGLPLVSSLWYCIIIISSLVVISKLSTIEINWKGIIMEFWNSFPPNFAWYTLVILVGAFSIMYLQAKLDEVYPRMQYAGTLLLVEFLLVVAVGYNIRIREEIVVERCEVEK